MSIFKTMVELQHKFNEETTPNYLEKNLNWNSAIIVESGELLDSLGFKWWKKQQPDMDNVKVEAIDLLHFVISETLQRNYTFRKELGVDFFNETIEEFRNPYTSFLFKKYESKGIEHLIYLLNKDEYPRFTIMKQIFKTLNMSNEDVYIAYITKNCLNKFRQANGYKNGTYKKYWNDKEDNVIAFELANKLGASENLFDELYKELETYYKQI